jgi:hypothetical protein
MKKYQAKVAVIGGGLRGQRLHVIWLSGAPMLF